MPLWQKFTHYKTITKHDLDDTSQSLHTYMKTWMISQSSIIQEGNILFLPFFIQTVTFLIKVSLKQTVVLVNIHWSFCPVPVINQNSSKWNPLILYSLYIRADTADAFLPVWLELHAHSPISLPLQMPLFSPPLCF